MANAVKGKTTPKVVDRKRLGFGALKNSTAGSLETICTVKEAAGKGGSFGFTSKNWTRAKAGKKLLAVKIVNAEEEQPAFIPCSVAVTEMILSGEIKMKHLANLNIVETEEGRLKIVLPEGSSQDQMVEADDVKAEALEFGEGDFLPTDLLEF